MKTRNLVWLFAFTGIVIVTLVFSGIFMSRGPSAKAAPPSGSNWNLTFEDNFDGDTLDSDKWATCWFWAGSDGGCINEANPQISYVLPRNVSVSDGNLHLRTVRENYTPPGSSKTYNWTSGMVTTDRIGSSSPANFAYTYGYAEIRAKLPAGSGQYSAFWYGADDHNWPPEIDGFEILGDRPTIDHGTLHWSDSNGNHQSQSQDYYCPNFTSDWHTFGVYWASGLVIWYVDDMEVLRSNHPEGVANEAMHMLLSEEIWSSSAWTSGPNSSTPNSAEFLVDYVRVWQSDGASNTPSSTKINPASTFGTGGNGSETYANAFDGNLNTAFDASDGTNCYVGMDAGNQVVAKQVRYEPRGYQGSRMVGGQFQGANSQGGPWSTLFTVPSAPGSYGYTSAMLNNTTSYRYYRYVGPTDGHCNIGEMAFYSASGGGGGGGGKINPSARFGTSGIGSSTYDKASDGNLNTAFDASDADNCATGIDAGSAVVLKQVRYSPRYWEADRMVNGRFQGANSQGGPWNTLYTISSEPGYGSLTSANVSTGTAYRYYQYVGPGDGHCNIGEMEFYS